jgi:secretion/DNA translocation related TadE-like protein
VTPRRARPVHGDDGIATVWAAAGVAVIMAALLLGLHLGAAVTARHRAEAAADLAALAAAGHAVHGIGAACLKAKAIAEEMGGEVARCLLLEWDALVEIHVRVPLTLPGTGKAVGRARAGPWEPGPAVLGMSNARSGRSASRHPRHASISRSGRVIVHATTCPSSGRGSDERSAQFGRWAFV